MKKYLLLLLLPLFILASSCERRTKQDVLILYPNWADGISFTYLAKVMLEDKGYTVRLKRLEPGPIFASLSRGDADIYMCAWLPYTHKNYWDRYEKKLDVLGTIFNDGITGLVVPTYVDINSIEELNENKDKFGEKIYGIASGAGIYKNTEIAIEEYRLDFKQMASSETSMITALKKAVNHSEWIVITGWKPHFIWSDFDLKPLADPKGVYPTDRIETISRKGFAEDKPELASFFSKFSLDEKLVNELMNDVAIDRDPEVGAKKFYDKHKSELNFFD